MTAPDPLARPQSSCSGQQTPLNIRWQSDRPSSRAKRKQSVRARVKTADANTQNSQHGANTTDVGSSAVCDERHSARRVEENVPSPASAISLTSSAFDEWCQTPGSQTGDDIVEEVGTSKAIQLYRPNSISPWISPLSSRTRMLFSHCQ